MVSTPRWRRPLATLTGDDGEPVPEPCVSRWWGAESGEVLHQTFSQEWATINREAVEEAGKLGEVGGSWREVVILD